MTENENRPRVLSIDFDGVLVNSDIDFKRYLRDSGVDKKPIDMDVDEFLVHWWAFMDTPYALQSLPLPYSINSIDTLKSAGNVLYVNTSRQQRHCDPTYRLINKYYPNVFDGIVFNQNDPDDGKKSALEIICRTTGDLPIHIDDSIKHVKQARGLGMESLYFITWPDTLIKLRERGVPF